MNNNLIIVVVVFIALSVCAYATRDDNCKVTDQTVSYIQIDGYLYPYSDPVYTCSDKNNGDKN